MPNPNGVEVLADGRILVAEFFRGTLLERKAGTWREIAAGHRSGDGIAHDGAGNLYLSEVRTGHVWRIDAASGAKELLATLQSAADLILDAERSQLVVPDSRAGELFFIPVPAPKRVMYRTSTSKSRPSPGCAKTRFPLSVRRPLRAPDCLCQSVEPAADPCQVPVGRSLLSNTTTFIAINNLSSGTKTACLKSRFIRL